MKKLIVCLLFLPLTALLAAQAPQQPPQAPPPQGGAFGLFGAPQPPQAPLAAPQVAPQVAPVAADDEATISLNLDNAADIYGVIRIIAGYLNLNYIIDPAVKGTININTAGPLRKSELLPILETILKINGATMIKTGTFYQIIPVGGAVRQPLPVQEAAPVVAPDDQMVLQVIRMKFVPATEMASLLNPYLSEGASIVGQGTGNVLLVTERRSNLKKLLEIVDIFDSGLFENEKVRLFPVKNNLARDLVDELSIVFGGYSLSQTSAVRFSALDRINSILALTSNPDVFPEIEKWLGRLDQSVVTVGVQNHVYKVKNGKASDIQGVLSQLYGGQVQLSTIYNQPSANPPSPAAPQIPGQTGASAPSAAMPFNPRNADVRIIADIVNNLLVIQASAQVYREIERTLEEIDVMARQVLIDAQIYEVTLDDSLFLGLSAILQNRGTLTPATTTAQFGTNAGPPTLSGQTFSFVGRSRELFAFLQASDNKSRVRTLSAPSVMVSDNKTAMFQVGAEVPVPTTSSVTPVQSGGTNLFAQTISYRPTGVLLNVTPQVNDSGNVTLVIAQEVSQASANTTSGVVAPVIGKSSVNSTIVVQDGQTIVLSGFIRENNERAQSRLPLLGRIPYLGVLFGNTRRSEGRSELLVLITPHVVRTVEEADLATKELKARLKEVQKMLN